MALSHLVDTSVLTRLHDARVRAVIEPLVRRGAAARAIISDLEIGFSARTGGEWDRLHQALEVFPAVDLTDWQVRRAQGVQRRLADHRMRGRKVPDLLVAAAAEERHLTVVHYDRDFDHIAEVTGQPCVWVIPAGAVD